MRRAIGFVLGISAIVAGCEQIGDLDDLVLDPCYKDDCSDVLVDGARRDGALDTSSGDSESEDATVADGPFDVVADRSNDVVTDAPSDAVTDARIDGATDASTDAKLDAPVDAQADAGDGSLDASTCPTTSPGPPMIKIGASACMDATEVTYTHYQAFLAAKASNVAGQPAACAWNKSYTPIFVSTASQPVRGVDWCDATAYCTWAGKQLCGPTVWRNACSTNGTTTYTYSGAFVSARCNDSTANLATVSNVASRTLCKTASGISDLNGNVWEWNDACSVSGGPSQFDDCVFAGGSFASGSTELPAQSFTCFSSYTTSRSYASADLGFRCCTP